MWGHAYRLIVIESTIKRPAADQPSKSWRLEQVVSDTEDQVGTRYVLPPVTMLDRIVTRTGGQYAFIDKPFSCVSATRCGELAALTKSQNRVTLTFRYLGGGEIELVDWSQAG